MADLRKLTLKSSLNVSAMENTLFELACESGKFDTNLIWRAFPKVINYQVHSFSECPWAFFEDAKPTDLSEYEDPEIDLSDAMDILEMPCSNGTGASQLPPSAPAPKNPETRFSAQDSPMKKDAKPSVITLKDFSAPVIKKKKLEVKTIEIYVHLHEKEIDIPARRKTKNLFLRSRLRDQIEGIPASSRLSNAKIQSSPTRARKSPLSGSGPSIFSKSSLDVLSLGSSPIMDQTTVVVEGKAQLPAAVTQASSSAAPSSNSARSARLVTLSIIDHAPATSPALPMSTTQPLHPMHCAISRTSLELDSSALC
ncbi:hypothetical protein B0H13DRAFT_2262539, partial [Mycena leptocephala]